MDDSALRRLPRTKIQGLARRENIKANQKTDCIIRSLVEKYPGGVPRMSQSPKKIEKLAGRIQRQLTAPFSVKREEPEEGSVRQVHDRAAAMPPRKSPPQDMETVTDNTKVPTDGLPTPVESLAPFKNKTEPSIKELRFVLRELTKLVNTGPDLQEEIHEAEILLMKTSELVKEVEKDMKEVVWTRFCMEEDFVKPLKEDRTLWDGTRLMKGEGRRRWEEYIAKQKEAHALKEKERKEREMAQQAQEMGCSQSEEGIPVNDEELQACKRRGAQETETERPKKRSRL